MPALSLKDPLSSEWFYVLPPVKHPDGKYYLKAGAELSSMAPVLETSEEISKFYKVNGRKKAYEFLKSRMQNLFPQVKFKAWKQAAGMVTYTKHGYPYIDYIDSGLGVALGCNGRGAKTAYGLGEQVAYTFLGLDNSPFDQSLFKVAYMPSKASVNKVENSFKKNNKHNEQKEVFVLGTIHGDHNRLPLYNFETIRIILEHIKPDILFIEEDPVTYKEKLYDKLSEKDYMEIRPVEIKKVLIPYAEKHNIKVVPTDWRVGYDEKSSEMKPVRDDVYKAVQHAYMSIFMDDYLTASVYDFHSDKTMAIIEGRELLLDALPKQKKVREIHTKRQRIINQNIIDGLKNNSFKKAVVVYGLSHRPAIIRAINKSRIAKVLSFKEAMKPRVGGLFKETLRIFLKKVKKKLSSSIEIALIQSKPSKKENFKSFLLLVLLMIHVYYR